MLMQPVGQLLFLGAALSFAMAVGGPARAATQVIVWMRSGGNAWRPFTYYSYARPVDKLLDADGKYIKLSFLGLHSKELVSAAEPR
jgi:hypothetical protein